MVCLRDILPTFCFSLHLMWHEVICGYGVGRPYNFAPETVLWYI